MAGDGAGQERQKAAQDGWAPKSAGASGSKLAGGGYSRPACARMSPISESRCLVGSIAIRMTGLAPSPRRSL